MDLQGLPFELDAWRSVVGLAAPDNHLVLRAVVVVLGRASVVAEVGPSAAGVAVLAAAVTG